MGAPGRPERFTVSTLEPLERSEYVPFMIETVSPGPALSAAFWMVRKGAPAEVPALPSLPPGLTKYVRPAAWAVPAPTVRRPSGADEASNAVVTARVLVRFIWCLISEISGGSGRCPASAEATVRNEGAEGRVVRGAAPGQGAGRRALKSAVRGVSCVSDSRRPEF